MRSRVSGDPRHHLESIRALVATRGITLPEKSIPGWLADTIGATCEGLWGTLPLKGEPPITRFSAMILSRDSILNDAKARRDIGYRPVISVEDGMRALAA